MPRLRAFFLCDRLAFFKFAEAALDDCGEGLCTGTGDYAYPLVGDDDSQIFGATAEYVVGDELLLVVSV